MRVKPDHQNLYSAIRIVCVLSSAAPLSPARMGTMSSATIGTGKRGRKPRTHETRVAVQSKLPVSTFDEIFPQVKRELGLTQSDFVAIATIRVANELRAEAGLEPIEMPLYLVEALEGSTPLDNPLQEALLEAS